VLTGVNFGNIYCRTTALGNLKTSKPDFMTWKEYTIFLLESIGIYNTDLMLHYYRKIKKFMTWYKKRDDIDVCDIPEEVNLKLESDKKAISWRRIARAIEKNDFYMKRLSFAQTKTDDDELRKLIHKWDNLLTEDTVSNDKDLNSFIKREVIKK
jgi:predicted phosphoadenosine phosphosulfate sulfurtransferase